MALFEINWAPDRRRLRVFGWAALVAFGALGAWAFAFHRLLGFEMAPTTARIAGWALWVLGAGCGLLATVAPGALRPLYVVLSALGWPIGWVVSRVVLAIVFYGVLMPIGLVMRLVGRDPLNRKFDRGASSYWTPHVPTTDPKRYFRPF
jgi:small neutral amino acid transporter SnatA (MarC family)